MSVSSYTLDEFKGQFWFTGCNLSCNVICVGDTQESSEPAFSKVELRNQRLHCPLTSRGFFRLQTLLGRFSEQQKAQPRTSVDALQTVKDDSSVCGSGGTATPTAGPSPRMPVAVLADVDENAFVSRG